MKHLNGEDPMPVIQQFDNFKIYMYFEDHNPPHVHLVGPGWDAKMRIEDQTIFMGSASSKIEKRAADYVADNVTALLERWDQYQ